MADIPAPLLRSLARLEGFDEQKFIEAHKEEHKITSLRFNPFKKVEVADFNFALSQPVPWAENGWYLDMRPSFTFDPLFHTGCYYVQEAGSMFVEFALKSTVDFTANLQVLDLCGAPGGKSTLINSLLNEESLLVANEFIKNRAGILCENLGKWGTFNTIVTNNDPAKFSAIPGFFDVLVIDAPCSGSGLFRKQPEAIEEWSEESVNHCSSRQREILQNALPCLKDSGILVYSTCSYSVKENEDIVRLLIAEYGMEYIALTVPTEWGIVDTGAGYRFYPHLVQSEGFFCAVLRKKTMVEDVYITKKKSASVASKSERAVLEPFLEQTDSLIIKKNNQFHMVNERVLNFLTVFEKQFYFKKAGCVLGEIKGSDMVPNHELAWSTAISKNVRTVELDLDNAVKFLKKENFNAGSGTKGLTLICYKHFGMGWAKILENRINNYMPNELRILSRKA